MLHRGGREADWLSYRDIKVYMEHKPYKHTAPPAHDDDDDNHIQPGLTLRHSHMLTMHFTLLLHSNTRMLCKKTRRTMSSRGSHPPSGPRLLIAAPPPTCSEVSDEFISYL